MKRLSYISRVLLLLTSVILFSCEGVLVPDPIDPRLPKFTEDGNNVAGAFIDGNKWKSVWKSYIFGSYTVANMVLKPSDNSLTLGFTGYAKDNLSTSFVFNLHRINCHTEKDILWLSGKKFILNNGIDSANIEGVYNCTYKAANIPGQIYFRSVKQMYDNGYIISGTFGFTVESSTGKLVEVTYGRFDYVLHTGSELLME